MPGLKVKRRIFGGIVYKNKKYKKVGVPVVGGVALSLSNTDHTTKGKYYLIGDYIFNDGVSPSIMGDDGYPCGLFSYFSGTSFIYFNHS